MTASPARLHIGQLLAHTTRHFQAELYRRLAEAGLEGLRVPHTHVSAYIEADGSRLTDLARKARMTVPAMLELVDDLERLGYAERRPDPQTAADQELADRLRQGDFFLDDEHVAGLDFLVGGDIGHR